MQVAATYSLFQLVGISKQTGWENGMKLGDVLVFTWQDGRVGSAIGTLEPVPASDMGIFYWSERERERRVFQFRVGVATKLHVAGIMLLDWLDNNIKWRLCPLMRPIFFFSYYYYYFKILAKKKKMLMSILSKHHTTQTKIKTLEVEITTTQVYGIQHW